jgi:hypothetical protein
MEGQLHGFYAWTDTLKGIYYGPGSMKLALPKLLAAIDAKKALIVTGKSLAKVCDHLRALKEASHRAI